MPLDGKNYQPCENARILREAANVIKEHGHAKGALMDRKAGGVCLRGAIICAQIGYENFYSRMEDREKFKELDSIVSNYLSRKNIINKEYEPAHVDWNNRPETTKEEVIVALEGAAIFAEEKVIA